MFQRNGVGFDWSTLFNLTKEEKEEALKQIKATNVDSFVWEQNRWLIKSDGSLRFDEILNDALKIEILKFCIEEVNFAFDVLSADECIKCEELFKRKQYDSKLLKLLLGSFLCFLHSPLGQKKSEGEKLWLYLERGVRQRAFELQEQKAEKHLCR